jgi:hypothetical protein
MRKEGFARFTVASHTALWKQMDAKKPEKGLGVQVQKTWYWYDSWIDQVRKHCEGNAEKYR